MNLGNNKDLYVQPFDHRGSFRVKLFGWEGALTDAQTAEIAATKQAIYDGFKAAIAARGVPIDRSGTFSMAFFTDFNVRGYVGLLDWYTVSVAACAVVLLGAHGATYLTLKTEGPVHNRSVVRMCDREVTHEPPLRTY